MDNNAVIARLEQITKEFDKNMKALLEEIGSLKADIYFDNSTTELRGLD